MLYAAVAALCFMEIWKRHQAELQYDWDVADFEIEEVTVCLLYTSDAADE